MPNMPAIGDQFHYVVAMDKVDDGTGTVFTAEEIERRGVMSKPGGARGRPVIAEHRSGQEGK